MSATGDVAPIKILSDKLTLNVQEHFIQQLKNGGYLTGKGKCDLRKNWSKDGEFGNFLRPHEISIRKAIRNAVPSRANINKDDLIDFIVANSMIDCTVDNIDDRLFFKAPSDDVLGEKLKEIHNKLSCTSEISEEEMTSDVEMINGVAVIVSLTKFSPFASCTDLDKNVQELKDAISVATKLGCKTTFVLCDLQKEDIDDMKNSATFLEVEPSKKEIRDFFRETLPEKAKGKSHIVVFVTTHADAASFCTSDYHSLTLLPATERFAAQYLSEYHLEEFEGCEVSSESAESRKDAERMVKEDSPQFVSLNDAGIEAGQFKVIRPKKGRLRLIKGTLATEVDIKRRGEILWRRDLMWSWLDSSSIAMNIPKLCFFDFCLSNTGDDPFGDEKALRDDDMVAKANFFVGFACAPGNSSVGGWFAQLDLALQQQQANIDEVAFKARILLRAANNRIATVESTMLRKCLVKKEVVTQPKYADPNCA